MPVLVFAEQRDGKMPKAAFEAVSQGRRVADGTVDRLGVCLVGNNISHLAETVAAYGADDIMLCDQEALSVYQTEPYAMALATAVEQFGAGLVLLGNTAMGKDLAPRIAARLGAGLVSDCTDMILDGREVRFIRPIYAGKVLATVRVNTSVGIATLRPNNFPVEKKQGEGTIQNMDVGLPKARARVTAVDKPESTRPELTEAEIIVSGGRGLGNQEGFEVIEKLADTIGAAVGASRAAVDAGWRHQQYQVGQTGKVVTPNLYLACGISGAIQHMAGMGSSRCIVTINKDPEANLMKVADLAIEGDLYEVVPEIIKQIKESKESKSA